MPIINVTSRGILIASLGFVLVQLDVSIVNIALPSIGTKLGASVSGLAWVVDAYTVAFASFMLPAGVLADRIGPRRMFLSGFAVFIAASALCGIAPGRTLLITARALQGIGAAALVPSSSRCSITLRKGIARCVQGPSACGPPPAASPLAAGPILGGLIITLVPLAPDLSAQRAGRALLAANPSAGLLVARIGPRLPITLGVVIAAAGFAMFYGLSAATPWSLMLPGLILIPAGIGTAVPAMTTALWVPSPRRNPGLPPAC